MKRATTVSLYDLLLPTQPLKNKRATASLSKPAPRATETPLKTFVIKEKRKKGPSPFKKNILLERLARFRQLQSQLPSPNNCTPDDDLSVLCFKKFVSKDIVDEEERLELLENVKDLLKPLTGKGFRVEIAGEDVLVWMDSHSAAVEVRNALHGMLIGGEALDVHLLRSTRKKEDHSSSLVAGDLLERPTEQLARYSDSFDASRGNHVLSLSNMVTAEDVADEEEAREVLQDVRTLLQDHTSHMGGIWISSLPCEDRMEDCMGMCWCLNAPPSCLRLGLVEEEGHLATEVIDFLQGSGIKVGYLHEMQSLFGSSNELQVRLRVIDYVEADQLGDEDEVTEICNDINRLLSPLAPLCLSAFTFSGEGPLRDMTINLDSLSRARLLRNRLMSFTSGGSQHKVCVEVKEVKSSSCWKVLKSKSFTDLFIQSDSFASSDVFEFMKALITLLRSKLPQVHWTRLQGLHSSHLSNELPFIGTLCSRDVLKSEERDCEVVVNIGFHDRLAAEDALLFCEGRVIGGRPIAAEITTASKDTCVIMVQNASAAMETHSLCPGLADHKDGGATLGTVHVSKYVAAKQVVKLPPSDLSEDWQREIPVELINNKLVNLFGFF